MSKLFDELRNTAHISKEIKKKPWIIRAILGVFIISLLGFNIKLFFIIKESDSKLRAQIESIIQRVNIAEDMINTNLNQINGLSGHAKKTNAYLEKMSLRVETNDAKIDPAITRLNRNEKLLRRALYRVNKSSDNLKFLNRELEIMDLKINFMNENILELEKINRGFINVTDLLFKKFDSLIEQVQILKKEKL